MKEITKKFMISFIAALLFVSLLGVPQISLAEDNTENPQPIVVPANRKPYIDSVHLRARGRYLWLLRENRGNWDVEYSKDFNMLLITFNHHKDDKNNIKLSEEVLRGITLYAKGATENLIDFENTSTALSRGDGKSTITIQTKGLSPNTEYYINIGEGLVSLTVADPNDSSKTATAYTPPVNIEFTTRTFPQVDSIIVGSVTENYNEKEPIIIKGDFFVNTSYDYVTVYFNSTEAHDVDILSDKYLEETYLRVYLPRGKNRLIPGTYDIVVSNGYDHETVLLSAFSVVEEGHHLPNETERLNSTTRIGDVIESVNTSDTTLMLSSRYSNTTILQVDLDDILGQDTLIRRIKYEAHRGDNISWLVTRSKWADISFTHVRASTINRKDDVEIITGRVDPYTAQVLKEKLKGFEIKSDFINASGSGYYVSDITLSIPYRESDGKHLKALRYDETTRRWEDEFFYIDEVEKKVIITTNNKGIFVIIETQD
ncbi:hypothetical protein [Proteiniborus sp. MB09-C3]|uniref:hypothetical protein n=1 Tax=Proteiniborus sp. MB09-C3 TaxID=3050072 RepID=UPI002554FFCF|nr:hypothetical protein [Proteiniborus sp. MB09-C3]WIV12252.1 hypothetical protein QO263_00585 [Proteiniborus sp. MB09-C3]